MFARDGCDVALVEVDALEADAAAGLAIDEVLGRSLDRLHVEDRDHRRQVGGVGLDQGGAGHDRPAAEAALLALIGVAAGAPEVRRELAGEPVGAAGAQRNRFANRVEAAHRVELQTPVLRDRPNGNPPGLGFVASAHLERLLV